MSRLLCIILYAAVSLGGEEERYICASDLRKLREELTLDREIRNRSGRVTVSDPRWPVAGLAIPFMSDLEQPMDAPTRHIYIRHHRSEEEMGDPARLALNLWKQNLPLELSAVPDEFSTRIRRVVSHKHVSEFNQWVIRIEVDREFSGLIDGFGRLLIRDGDEPRHVIVPYAQSSHFADEVEIEIGGDAIGGFFDSRTSPPHGFLDLIVATDVWPVALPQILSQLKGRELRMQANVPPFAALGSIFP